MTSQSSRKIPAPDGGGPNVSAPIVPQGWLAQWESNSKRWYFVQHATGHTQWELPTEPFIPTPSSTPATSIASPGPYHPPIPGTEDEATVELRNVRTGANWSSGSDFATGTMDSDQSQPVQGHSPGLQTTPVPTTSGHASRASNDGMFSKVVHDLANRAASSEMSGVQQTTPQNTHGYPTPSQRTTPGSDPMSMNPQYSQDTQQPLMAQASGYQSQTDPMELENPRVATQDQTSSYRRPDSGTYAQQGYHTSTPERTGQQGPYYTSGAPYQGLHPDSMAGVQPTHTHTRPEAASAPPSTYQQFGTRPPAPPHPAHSYDHSTYPAAAQPYAQPRYPTAPPAEPVVIRSDRPLFPTPYSQSQPPRRGEREPHYQYGQYDQTSYGTRRPPAPSGRQGQPYYDSGPQPNPYVDSYPRNDRPPPTSRYETGRDPRYPPDPYAPHQPRTAHDPTQYPPRGGPSHHDEGWYDQAGPPPGGRPAPGYIPGAPAPHPGHYPPDPRDRGYTGGARR